MVKVGVNGFGRIGRNVLRAALEKKNDIEFVASERSDVRFDTLAYLLKYDSVHKTIPNRSSTARPASRIDGKELRVFSSPDPARNPVGRDRGRDRGGVVGTVHGKSQGCPKHLRRAWRR